MDYQLEYLAEQRKTNKLLAVIATRSLTRIEQILILDQAGFKPAEIADLIDTTANSVSVALTNHRKRRKKNGKR